MKVIHWIAFTLLIIGGLNWGLTAFDYNVVDKIFGSNSNVTDVIYVLVGLSAVWELATHGKNCRRCKPDGSSAPAAM